MRRIHVVLPKPKPKKKSCKQPRKSEKRCKPAQLTPRKKDEKVAP
jgi:hypothetical protein